MLLSTVAFALVLAAQIANGDSVCPLDGTDPQTVEGNNNYVIDKFQDYLLFTYAMNQCTTNTVGADKWYKYLCSKNGDEWKVTKYSYTDSACANDETVFATWNHGDSEKGTVGYFNCDGDNSYAEIEVSINSQCADTQIVYAGVGGCAYNALPTKFYCNDDKALVQFFERNYASTTTAPATTSGRRLLAATTEVAATTDSATTDSATTDSATDVLTTETETTEMETSEVETTEFETTDVETTDVETTDFETSESETTDVETTEFETSELETSEVETSEIETSEVETSEVETSEVETSEVETSEVETSETETSEIESSEAETTTTIAATTTTATTTTTAAPVTTMAPEYCPKDLYCSAWSFETKCGPVNVTLPQGQMIIFGRLAKCSISTETTTITKGAASFFVMINLVVAIFALLF